MIHDKKEKGSNNTIQIVLQDLAFSRARSYLIRSPGHLPCILSHTLETRVPCSVLPTIVVP